MQSLFCISSRVSYWLIGQFPISEIISYQLALIFSEFIPAVSASSFYSKFLKYISFFSARSSSFFWTRTFLMALYAQSFNYAI